MDSNYDDLAWFNSISVAALANEKAVLMQRFHINEVRWNDYATVSMSVEELMRTAHLSNTYNDIYNDCYWAILYTC